MSKRRKSGERRGSVGGKEEEEEDHMLGGEWRTECEKVLRRKREENRVMEK